MADLCPRIAGDEEDPAARAAGKKAKRKLATVSSPWRKTQKFSDDKYDAKVV